MLFLDVQQAFDKFRHKELLFKYKNYYSERQFQVKVNEEISEIYDINSRVPQIYTIFTLDMPVANNILVATYADDTAILAHSCDSIETLNFV